MNKKAAPIHATKDKVRNLGRAAQVFHIDEAHPATSNACMRQRGTRILHKNLTPKQRRASKRKTSERERKTIKRAKQKRHKHERKNRLDGKQLLWLWLFPVAPPHEQIGAFSEWTEISGDVL